MRLDQFERGHRKQYREPQKTIEEIAEMLGISYGSLCAYMSNHKDAPKRTIDGRNKSPSRMNNRNSYYSPSEFREWWKKVLDTKK